VLIGASSRGGHCKMIFSLLQMSHGSASRAFPTHPWLPPSSDAPERILMSPRGGVNRRICTLINRSVLKPVRPVSKTSQTGFTQTEPIICESPLRVLAQTKLGVGLPQGFPRVSMKSLHTTQAHQRRSKRKHKIYVR
jgi:hypothetical protein